MAAGDYANDADNDENERFAEFILGFFDEIAVFAAAFAGEIDNIIEENGEEKDADKGVAAGDGVAGAASDAGVEKEDDESGGNKKEEREFFGNGILADFDGFNHGGDADKEEDVDNVAAHDVAEEHVGVAGNEGRDGNGEFGGAGAESDDGEADKLFADFEIRCDRGGAGH